MPLAGLNRAEGLVTTTVAGGDRILIQKLQTSGPNSGQYLPRIVTYTNFISGGGGGTLATTAIPYVGPSGDFDGDVVNLNYVVASKLLTATNMSVGSNGVAGSLSLFSGTALKGKWLFTPVDNTGNTTMTITNAAQGGARTYTIPDAGASATFLMSAGNPTIATGSLFIESAADSITAFAGGGQASATLLANEINRVTTVATAGDSIKLPVSIAGLTVFVINHGANSMQVFGSGTDTIDDVATATGVAQMAGSLTLYSCTTAGAWYAEGVGTGYSGGLQTLAFSTGLTAHAGGTQAAALLLTASINNVTVVATANDSVRLPASAPGLTVTILNNGVASMQVFGLGTDTINSVATATGVSQLPGTVVTYICTVTGNWLTGANLQAGANGVAGKITLFPATASNGTLVVQAANNASNFASTVTNSAVGQATTYTLPDPVAAAATIALTIGVNGTEAANAVTASGLDGVITTSSLSTAGAGSYAITWTNSKIASTSKVLVTYNGGTNTTRNITIAAVPGSGTATLTIYNNTAATALNGTVIMHYWVIP